MAYAYIFIYRVSLLAVLILVAWSKHFSRGLDFSYLPSDLGKQYLAVYFMVVTADWLQGPYTYALYQKYGFSETEIAQLFVAGFASSLLFGTIVGSLADSLGRKKFCLLYIIFYSASCVTKHISNFWVLSVGRIFSGIATSLLFSVFEAWLLGATKQRAVKYAEYTQLDPIFSLSVILNSVSAIFSGVFAQFISDSLHFQSWQNNLHFGGFVGPFDAAIIVLFLAAFVILRFWEENYGEKKSVPLRQSLDNLCQAASILANDKALCALGLVQSCFEGSMYAFVFEWTPALILKDQESQIPFGVVFSTFMIGCMIGSQCFGFLSSLWPTERILIVVFFLSAISLSFVLSDFLFDTQITYYGFIAFEICVGAYFPAIGTLKAKLVPEEHRSSIYNLYRIPLNIIVMCILLSGFSVASVFVVVVGLLCIGCGLQMFVASKIALARELVML